MLEKFGIDAYEGGKKIAPSKIDWSSAQPLQLSYRQAPGKDNPLGFLKINFANSSSVYMHDSPKESLFGRNFRAASSGCVRVQNIEELAAWLLTVRAGATSKLSTSRRAARPKRSGLSKPVTLYFAYVTAWATRGRRDPVPARYLPKGRGRRDRRGILSFPRRAIDRDQCCSAERRRNLCVAGAVIARRDNRHVARHGRPGDDKKKGPGE